MIDKDLQDQQQKQAAGRILQLDAHVLDSTLIGIIRSQLQLFTKLLLHNHTRTYGNENWWHHFLLNNYEVLLESLVPLLYFLAPIFTGQSPGQRLMNVRYGNFTNARGLLNYVLNTFTPNMVNIISQTSEATSRWQTIVRRVSMVFKMADFLYFFHFLRHGGSANLVERLLGLEIIFDRRPSIGQINYGALNRELFGHTFAQLIILSSPLLIILRKFLSRKFKSNIPQRMTPDYSNQARMSNLKCAECLQKANCAVRAIKKSLLTNPAAQHQWESYCFLCFINLYDNNWSQTMKMEQIKNFE